MQAMWAKLPLRFSSFCYCWTRLLIERKHNTAECVENLCNATSIHQPLFPSKYRCVLWEWVQSDWIIAVILTVLYSACFTIAPGVQMGYVCASLLFVLHVRYFVLCVIRTSHCYARHVWMRRTGLVRNVSCTWSLGCKPCFLVHMCSHFEPWVVGVERRNKVLDSKFPIIAVDISLGLYIYVKSGSKVGVWMSKPQPQLSAFIRFQKDIPGESQWKTRHLCSVRDLSESWGLYVAYKISYGLP